MAVIGKASALTHQVEERNNAIVEYKAICERQAQRISDIERNISTKARGDSDNARKEYETTLARLQESQKSEQQLKQQCGRLSDQVRSLELKLDESKYEVQLISGV
jgi:chromosome segregation ATPase